MASQCRAWDGQVSRVKAIEKPVASGGILRKVPWGKPALYEQNKNNNRKEQNKTKDPYLVLVFTNISVLYVMYLEKDCCGGEW